MWGSLTAQYITAIGLFIVVIVDIFLAVDKVPNNTWSEVIEYWATTLPVIGYAAGVICGHWFGLRGETLVKIPGNYILLIWLAGLITIIGFALRQSNLSFHPLLACQIGILSGYYLWSQ